MNMRLELGLVKVAVFVCIAVGCVGLIVCKHLDRPGVLIPPSLLILFATSWVLVPILWWRMRYLEKLAKCLQTAEANRVARAQAEENARRDQKEAEAQHKRHQQRISHALTQLVSDTHGTIEILPSVIAQAEAALDNAEFEFGEGAFVPFWDAVEKAVASLDSYDNGIKTITSNAQRIPEEIKKLDNHPRIDLSTLAWPEATPTIMRMRQIVRQAQKNIDFTTVYQQRRTNGILVAGFANLGSAIEDMGTRIQGSINVLTQTVDSSMSAIAEQSAEFHRESLTAMEAQREQQVSDAEAQREQSASDSKAHREHERKVEEMTDNIQRRKTPFWKHWRDGKY